MAVVLVSTAVALVALDLEASAAQIAEPPSVCIVAGTSVFGGGLDQLRQPTDIFLDNAGDIYIADRINYRVMKWAPGATEGTIVAGTGVFGPGLDQLGQVTGVFVDDAGNVYAADSSNHRITKWARGATEGTIVAGTGVPGARLDQLSGPSDVFVDSAGNIYVADRMNRRVVKWPPGATEGTIVAGTSGFDPGLDQLGLVEDVFVDDAENIYVADRTFHRVMKWAPGATEGTIVAGTGGFGPGLDQLAQPSGVFVDDAGGVYVAERTNYRVMKFAPGATNGTIVAGTGVFGSVHFGVTDLNRLGQATGVFVDDAGNIYVADTTNNRVIAKGPVCTASLTLTKTVEGGAAAASDFALLVTQTGAESVRFASGTAEVLGPGEYSLSETGPGGYRASDWQCTIERNDTTVTSIGHSLTLLRGDVAVCSITNSYVGSDEITISKIWVGDGPHPAVTFTITPTNDCRAPNPATVSIAAGVDPATVAFSSVQEITAPGSTTRCTYKISEAAVAGYAPSADIGGIEAGSAVSFTNSARQPDRLPSPVITNAPIGDNTSGVAAAFAVPDAQPGTAPNNVPAADDQAQTVESPTAVLAHTGSSDQHLQVALTLMGSGAGALAFGRRRRAGQV